VLHVVVTPYMASHINGLWGTLC